MGPKNFFESLGSDSTADESVSFQNILALCERATGGANAAHQEQDPKATNVSINSKVKSKGGRDEEWFGLELVKLSELLGKF